MFFNQIKNNTKLEKKMCLCSLYPFCFKTTIYNQCLRKILTLRLGHAYYTNIKFVFPYSQTNYIPPGNTYNLLDYPKSTFEYLTKVTIIKGMANAE